MYLVITYRVIDIDSSTANCQDLVLTSLDQHVPKMKFRSTVFIRLTALAHIKFLDLESGRLFEAGRLLNFHHFQQV